MCWCETECFIKILSAPLLCFISIEREGLIDELWAETWIYSDVLAVKKETHIYCSVHADTSGMCFIYSGSCVWNSATPSRSIVKAQNVIIFTPSLLTFCWFPSYVFERKNLGPYSKVGHVLNARCFHSPSWRRSFCSFRFFSRRGLCCWVGIVSERTTTITLMGMYLFIKDVWFCYTVCGVRVHVTTRGQKAATKKTKQKKTVVCDALSLWPIRSHVGEQAIFSTLIFFLLICYQ